MPKHRSISIQDVADAAKVSTATVSRVVNNPELVATATAERVQDAIKELGYRPNLLARGLMTRKTRVIEIALPDIHGEFYSGVLRGADAEARELGYHLLISAEPHSGRQDGLQGLVAYGLISGMVVMITEPNATLRHEAESLDVPVVLIDSEAEGGTADTVTFDNVTGTREATKHLLGSTRPERCYFVGGPPENFDTRVRAETFASILADAGSPAREEQLAFGAYDVDFGSRWLSERLDSGADLRGSAILAGNDEIAYGIVHVAQERGISIPETLRVIGFDDTRLATLLRPALSSVRIPMEDVGAAAVRTLIRRIQEPEAPVIRQKYPSELVIRASSRVDLSAD